MSSFERNAMNDNNFVKFKGNGYYYNIYNEDAYIISYIMGYKLVEKNGNVYTGFPCNMLNEVLSFLEKNKISYMVDNTMKDYGSLNQYNKFVKKDLPVKSIIQTNNKIYSGNFSVMFEGEDIEKYEIGKNISSDAEIVKMIYENKVNSICISKSGEKFKIISKDIIEK